MNFLQISSNSVINLITSDSDSVSDAYNSHHYAKDGAHASCMAVKDGGDDVSIDDEPPDSPRDAG